MEKKNYWIVNSELFQQKLKLKYVIIQLHAINNMIMVNR